MGDFLITLIKFFIAVLLLPVIIASTTAFQDHLLNFPSIYQEFFLWGALGFLLIFLFLYQFWGVYEFGQKLTEIIFSFISPLNRSLTNIIPFYTVSLLLIFYITKIFLGVDDQDHYFIFFIGFTLTMHILLTAQNLQEEEKTPIKPNYLFAISFIYIFNIFLLVFFFDLIIGKFQFPQYFTRMIENTSTIYHNILKFTY